MKKRHKIEKPEVEHESSDILESSSSEGIPGNDFCIPENCPEIIETPRFPSPTSCLQEERLHELEEKIDAANRLLLDLGLSGEQKEHGRRVLFDGLKGKKVKVKINCTQEAGEDIDETQGAEAEVSHIEQIVNKKLKMSGNPHLKKRPKTKRGKKKSLQYKHQRKARKPKKDFIEGTVNLVGRNFVEMTNKQKIMLIPLSKVCVVLTKKKYEPPVHDPSLIDIDPCFRRELTFNFGETVANDPELIQLFFRINLLQYLKRFTGQKLTLRTSEGQIQGILKGTDNDSILLDDAASTSANIPAESICLIIKN